MFTNLADIDPEINVTELYNDSCDYYTIDAYNEISNQSLFNVTLLNFNIRSFSKNIDCFQSFILSFKNIPEFIVLSETWNTDNFVSYCNFDGYRSTHSYRESMRGGGVSVFCLDRFFITKDVMLSPCSGDYEFCTSFLRDGGE